MSPLIKCLLGKDGVFSTFLTQWWLHVYWVAKDLMALIWFSSVVGLDPHPASGSSILELVIVMSPTRLGFTTSLPSALTLYPRKGMFLLTCSKSFTHILNYIFRSVPRSEITSSKYVINFTAFEMYCQIVLQKSYSLLPFLWTLALTPYYFEKTFSNLLSKTMFFYCFLTVSI